jgi:GNAT superfamily N-acetyltransferase
VKIERMTSSDLNDVTDLAIQLGYPNTVEAVASRFEEIQGAPDYALFVAKDEDGKVVGYIQINREPCTLLAGPRADVAALVVDQTVRSKGIGAALLQEAEKWAVVQGLSMIRVRSNVSRTDAHRFYQKNGYEISKTGHTLIKAIG